MPAVLLLLVDTYCLVYLPADEHADSYSSIVSPVGLCSNTAAETSTVTASAEACSYL